MYFCHLSFLLPPTGPKGKPVPLNAPDIICCNGPPGAMSSFPTSIIPSWTTSETKSSRLLMSCECSTQGWVSGRWETQAKRCTHVLHCRSSCRRDEVLSNHFVLQHSMVPWYLHVHHLPLPIHCETASEISKAVPPAGFAGCPRHLREPGRHAQVTRTSPPAASPTARKSAVRASTRWTIFCMAGFPWLAARCSMGIIMPASLPKSMIPCKQGGEASKGVSN